MLFDTLVHSATLRLANRLRGDTSERASISRRFSGIVATVNLSRLLSLHLD
jgi:hypothetical protein